MPVGGTSPRVARRRGAKWIARLETSGKAEAFEASLDLPDEKALGTAMTAYKDQLLADAPKVATRKASEMALE